MFKTNFWSATASTATLSSKVSNKAKNLIFQGFDFFSETDLFNSGLYEFFMITKNVIKKSSFETGRFVAFFLTLKYKTQNICILESNMNRNVTLKLLYTL